jgi:tRNA(Ile)-lysidine synthase
VGLGEGPNILAFDAAGFAQLPAEIALRLVGRALGQAGSEGPVELGKLEALQCALDSSQNAGSRFRRSLAGAIVTLSKGKIVVERAPARRNSGTQAGIKALTKRRPGRATPPKTR